MLFKTFFSYFKIYLPALLWASVIAFLSLTASGNLPHLDWTFITPDKAGHFTVYAILAFLVLFGYAKHSQTQTIATYIYVAMGAAAYGFLMEWAQYLLTPDRCFEYPDMLANAIGALLGVSVFYFFAKHRPLQDKIPVNP
jgi:VanZ family protein